MQNPEERDLEARLRDPAFTSFDSFEDASIEPVDPVPPVYKQEPLFNKKVMLAWAIGAAILWFAVSFVVPIAVDSAKGAIKQSIREVETKDGKTVIITPGGHRITITGTPPSAVIAAPPEPNPPAGAPVPPAAHDPANPTQGPAELQSPRK